MPILRVRDTGQVGIIDDIHPQTLPPHAWSEGSNVRCRNNRIEKIKGYREVLKGCPIVPITVFFIPRVSDFVWVACSQTAVWVYSGSQWNEITKSGATYGATLDVRWTGGLLGNDVLILNNGSDDPQAWMTIDAGTLLIDMADWAVNTKANCIRSFNDFLIALDVTEAGTRHTDVLLWSHPADPGTVPSSWDYSDPTKDTGRVLLEGGGTLIDALPLRGINIIYGETATWAMQFVGGTFVHSFDKIFNTTGILSRNCVAFYRGNHILLSQGDLLMHDGISSQSIIDGRRRKWLFNNIDTTNYQKSFVAVNDFDEEIWVCFPSAGHSIPNKALVLEAKTGACTERDLPDAGAVTYGAITDTTSPIDDDGTILDVADQIYDEMASNPALYKPIIADQTNSKFYEAQSGNINAGTAFTAYVAREDIELDDQRRTATITRIYPIIDGSGTVNVYVGSQSVPRGAVDWNGPYAFVIGTDFKIDLRVHGRYHAIKFESTGNASWELSGYDIEYQPGGIR